MNIWESFCGDTSLHGYQYVGRLVFIIIIIIIITVFYLDRRERRAVWCGVVLLSVLAALLLVAYNLNDFLSSFTVTTLESSTEEGVISMSYEESKLSPKRGLFFLF